MIHTCMKCDEDGCDKAQSVGFDDEHETWGDMLNGIRAIGWLVTGGPTQQTVRVICPTHANRAQLDANIGKEAGREYPIHVGDTRIGTATNVVVKYGSATQQVENSSVGDAPVDDVGSFSWVEAMLFREPVLIDRSIAHCHSRHVHSLVFRAGPPMVRMFFADELHDLWRNEARIQNGRATFDEPMSVAAHSHRQNITMVPVFGHVMNVEFTTDGLEGVPSDLVPWMYNSHILQGSGWFSQYGDGMPLRMNAIDLLTRPKQLTTRNIHTVFVPKGERAAWFIIEGEHDDLYDPTCWSNDNLKVVEFSSLYHRMGRDQAVRIMAICQSILSNGGENVPVWRNGMSVLGTNEVNRTCST